MRIGLFIDDYLPHDSGIITATIHLQKGLMELGHEVYIIAPSQPGYTDLGPNVIRMSSINPLVFHKARAVLPTRKSVGKIIDLDLDIVHSITQYNMGIVADFVAKRTDVPHVTSAHTIFAELVQYYPTQGVAGYLFFSQLYQIYFKELVKVSMPKLNDFNPMRPRSFAILKRQVWNMQNVFLNNVDHVMMPSDHMNRHLLNYGMKTPSSVIPNGIDTNFYDIKRTRPFRKDGRLRIACVGRLSDEKRQNILIEAAVRNPLVDLEIVGDGPSRTDYQNLAKAFGIADRVTFHGSQKQEYIRELLAECDAFALASYNFDTQGVVLLEAAAAGLPIIYCDDNLSDFVSPDAGLLARPTAAGIEMAFEYLLADDADFKAMSKQSKEFAAQFDYIQFAQRSLDVYETVLAAV